MTNLYPLSKWARVGAVTLLLTACTNQTEQGHTPGTEPKEAPSAVPEADEPISIIRPDAGIETVEPRLEPLEQRISFNDGGSQLSGVAIEELQAVLESRQISAGGAITLRGHTDSEGRDDANLRASANRAEAVKTWLVKKGVSEDRISVIALGEQNPAKPNALPDGTPNEEGRAFNRRVDVSIDVPESDAAVQPDEAPTLVERVAADD